ncbi:prefoldin subunit, putative [Eimeria tenella]|uniref:Prefoldin subunit, putative n=1 Tax=Eimeria tenella TaxID=5802 RepID=U6KMF8_EIMTE|nr:prefoldin subunit, putative [Eimeria tenella]CDJ37452.1 prefoldin subunit, putative [Eimeria tenella]|eukprot:XP_013228290.1 prefoldin subunit, putative [Eimeria tenella]
MSGERLKETTAEMDALMERLQTNAQNVNRLVPQRTELQAVANELTAAAEDAIVYKMIGPVLVRQSKSEALQTVNKRLDYVQRELSKPVKLHSSSSSSSSSRARHIAAAAAETDAGAPGEHVTQQQQQQHQNKPRSSSSRTVHTAATAAEQVSSSSSGRTSQQQQQQQQQQH